MSEEVKKSKWEKGDWCFFQFRLAQVDSVTDTGTVTRILDGNVSCGGSRLNDRMFPLTLANKTISDYHAYHYDYLQRKYQQLNFPDIHRWFIRNWVNTMAFPSGAKHVEMKNKELRQFVEDIEEHMKKYPTLEVDGVRIIR